MVSQGRNEMAQEVGHPSELRGIVCNTSGVSPFTTSQVPPLPVLATFGGERLHQCQSPGRWDIELAVSENADALMRSSRFLPPDKTSDPIEEWRDVIFQFGPRAFVHAEQGNVTGYAASLPEAERLATEFVKKYKLPAIPSGGSFELIRISRDDICTESVPLDSNTILADETLNLHYDDGFAS